MATRHLTSSISSINSVPRQLYREPSRGPGLRQAIFPTTPACFGQDTRRLLRRLLRTSALDNTLNAFPRKFIGPLTSPALSKLKLDLRYDFELSPLVLMRSGSVLKTQWRDEWLVPRLGSEGAQLTCSGIPIRYAGRRFSRRRLQHTEVSWVLLMKVVEVTVRSVRNG